MENCSEDGCDRGACIHLEIFQRTEAGTVDRKAWLCEAHAEEVEAYCEMTPGDFTKRLEVIPVVGMGATTGYGADCYPWTIIGIADNGNMVIVQSDDHRPGPGHHYINNQVYTYHRNPSGEVKVYTKRKNGRYVLLGDPLKGGATLGVGHRRYHRDPSF